MQVQFIKIYIENCTTNLAVINMLFYDAANPAILVLLLPFTLTIGAGIISLIDYFSRQNIDEKKFNNVCDKISELESSELQSLVDLIKNSKPLSRKSHQLKNELQAISKDDLSSQYQLAHAEKLLRFSQCPRIDDHDPSEVYQKKFVELDDQVFKFAKSTAF